MNLSLGANKPTEFVRYADEWLPLRTSRKQIASQTHHSILPSKLSIEISGEMTWD